MAEEVQGKYSAAGGQGVDGDAAQNHIGAVVQGEKGQNTRAQQSGEDGAQQADPRAGGESGGHHTHKGGDEHNALQGDVGNARGVGHHHTHGGKDDGRGHTQDGIKETGCENHIKQRVHA